MSALTTGSAYQKPAALFRPEVQPHRGYASFVVYLGQHRRLRPVLSDAHQLLLVAHRIGEMRAQRSYLCFLVYLGQGHAEV